jgi:hypothetical protein
MMLLNHSTAQNAQTQPSRAELAGEVSGGDEDMAANSHINVDCAGFLAGCHSLGEERQ